MEESSEEALARGVTILPEFGLDPGIDRVLLSEAVRSLDQVEEIMAGMPTAFSAEADGDIVADIQFHVNGEEPGDYHLQIEGGTCTFREGASEAPKLTIHTPSDVWVAISNGEMDGQQAFMQGRYRVEGDFSLLMKLNDIFKAG